VLINNALRQTKVNSTTFSSDATANSNGDVLIIAVDFDAGKGWVGKNGTWYDSGNPSAGTSPCTTTVSGGMTPAYQAYNAGSLSFNAGQRAFSYTPPTGFVALNTYNLPTSTIVKGNTVMDATLWTGDGTTPKSQTNAAGFKPDFVWIKSRSNAYSHNLFDSVRGAGAARSLQTDNTKSESDVAVDTALYGYLSAFNSNGFSTTNGSTTPVWVNASGSTYVAWQWQAGQGTNTSNTNGTITSTVSVNASAGFSVVTFTGQTSGVGTVGHGLGVAPSLIIIKSRANAYGWPVYHISLGNTNYIVLNTTNAVAADANEWNNTSPTSSVFTLGTNFISYGTAVAYCWTPIAGYSAFGSYTGNGSADGTFVYTGFRPKFVLIKWSGGVENWAIIDTSRATYNAVINQLFSNTAGAENTDANQAVDILSNGFKLRGSLDLFNRSSGAYIYMAFAENPTKYALAR
jgi:hypothetical protein